MEMNEQSYRLEDALAELERVWKIEPPLGGSDIGIFDRYLPVVQALRDRVCPLLMKMAKVLKSKEASLVAALLNVFGPAIVGKEYAVATLYRDIVVLGIDKFCENPEGLLECIPNRSGS
jgi:hypothetical protein